MAGIDDAWTWKIGRFRRYAFLATDDVTVFRMNAVDGDHQDLFAEVVRFSRSHGLPDPAAPVEAVPGFASANYRFDVLGLPQRSVYGYDEAEFPELSRVALIVFPAFECEISGSESHDDAVFRVTRAMQIARLSREPAPFLKVKYRNPAFGGITDGEERHFMPFDALKREIRQLDGIRAGLVEFETFTGTVWRVSWDENFHIEGPASYVLPLDGLLQFAFAAVYGNESRSS